MTQEWLETLSRASQGSIFYSLKASHMGLNSLLESPNSLPEELRSILTEIGRKQQEAMNLIASNPQHYDISPNG